ncbi:hypothetical protein PAPYR_10143 [Paratrimastix pyriformis]|uniref:Uncharacterized protein n=1 Tax=Paratrimastix pyriformis TaxID=342808 RepID=A0ABQ8UCB1_9EUKA|nr:hypothetical protein PAPYR_10143 [Paratrimastix pyriformis]
MLCGLLVVCAFFLHGPGARRDPLHDLQRAPCPRPALASLSIYTAESLATANMIMILAPVWATVITAFFLIGTLTLSCVALGRVSKERKMVLSFFVTLKREVVQDEYTRLQKKHTNEEARTAMHPISLPLPISAPAADADTASVVTANNERQLASAPSTPTGPLTVACGTPKTPGAGVTTPDSSPPPPFPAPEPFSHPDSPHHRRVGSSAAAPMMVVPASPSLDGGSAPHHATRELVPVNPGATQSPPVIFESLVAAASTGRLPPGAAGARPLHEMGRILREDEIPEEAEATVAVEPSGVEVGACATLRPPPPTSRVAAMAQLA